MGLALNSLRFTSVLENLLRQERAAWKVNHTQLLILTTLASPRRPGADGWADNSATPNALSLATGRRPNCVAMQLKELRERRLVQRRPATELKQSVRARFGLDRRSVLYYLTEDGMSLTERIGEALRRLDQAANGIVTSKAQGSVALAVRRLAELIDKLDSVPGGDPLVEAQIIGWNEQAKRRRRATAKRA